MVTLTTVHSNITTLATSQPLVAVFIGGTSGIGKHTLKSLAQAHGAQGKGLRAYIVGRNATAAQDINSYCKKVCESGEFIFIQAGDLALLRDVDVTCAEIRRQEEDKARGIGGVPRIDILVLTQAIFKPWDTRNETPEGLDRHISLLYYSRMRCILNLRPLLLSSTLPAHVISVYGPGRDTVWIPDDLSLRSAQNYSFRTAGSHAAYLTTFFMEFLAAGEFRGKVAFVHYFPGLVLSDGFQDPTFPLWFRAVFKYGGPVISMFPMTLGGGESGDRTLFNASSRFPPSPKAGNTSETSSQDGKTAPAKPAGHAGHVDDGVAIAESSDGVVGGGAYRVNYDNEQVATPKKYVTLREEGWLEKIVTHTFQAFEDIEAGRRFSR